MNHKSANFRPVRGPARYIGAPCDATPVVVGRGANNERYRGRRELPATLLAIGQAEALADRLNSDKRDDWHYSFELVRGDTNVNGRASRAKVTVYDEEGNFVGYL